jgi:phenylacetate-CoA ligase
MPLIRFDIGDHATIGVDPCPCGRGSPYLSNIIGREIEFLVLRDGRRLSPYRLTTAVETVPGLLKYRFIQTQDRSLSMEVVLAKNGRTEATQTSQIRESLRTILGNSVDVPIRVVEEIRRTRGGKHRIVSQSSTAD